MPCDTLAVEVSPGSAPLCAVCPRGKSCETTGPGIGSRRLSTRECRGFRRVAFRDTFFEFSAPVAAFQVIRECGRPEARRSFPVSTAQRELVRSPCNANLWAARNSAEAGEVSTSASILSAASKHVCPYH